MDLLSHARNRKTQDKNRAPGRWGLVGAHTKKSVGIALYGHGQPCAFKFQHALDCAEHFNLLALALSVDFFSPNELSSPHLS